MWQSEGTAEELQEMMGLTVSLCDGRMEEVVFVCSLCFKIKL